MTVRSWLFQDDIPTACSRVITDIPAYAYLTYRIIGSDGVKKDSAFKKHYNVLNSENVLTLTLWDKTALSPGSSSIPWQLAPM